jgi:hypothetical protein
MHNCCPSCFKYCKAGKRPECRHYFPKKITKDPAIVTQRDKKSRVKVYVHTKRNNSNMNPTFTSPLAQIAHNGNHDLQQMIVGTGGAVEYTCSYAAKAEAPDSSYFKNMMLRILSKHANKAGMYFKLPRSPLHTSLIHSITRSNYSLQAVKRSRMLRYTYAVWDRRSAVVH